jgi:hypothetical protein
VTASPIGAVSGGGTGVALTVADAGEAAEFSFVAVTR